MNMPRVLCDKCKKEAPIDLEKSNANWKVYDMKTPCECGGKFKITIEQEGLQ